MHWRDLCTSVQPLHCSRITPKMEEGAIGPLPAFTVVVPPHHRNSKGFNWAPANLLLFFVRILVRYMQPRSTAQVCFHHRNRFERQCPDIIDPTFLYDNSQEVLCPTNVLLAVLIHWIELRKKERKNGFLVRIVYTFFVSFYQREQRIPTSCCSKFSL